MQQVEANAPSPPWGIQVNIPKPANAEGQSTCTSAHWERTTSSAGKVHFLVYRTSSSPAKATSNLQTLLGLLQA